MTVVKNPPRTETATRPRALPELLLVAVLFLAYKLGRALIEGHVARAFDNAWRVWDLERMLHLPSEVAVQQAVLPHGSLVHIANSYYAYVHFPATAAFLLFMYLRRPTYYVWARRSIAGLTAAALVLHVLVPLAPPRLLTGTGMLDTGHLFGPAVYGNVSTDTLSNQYAAMPSLHVGWALAIAVGLIATTRSRLRWAWLLYPLMTGAVVVVTGNHYWLDGIVATALLGMVLVICPWPGTVQHRFFGRARHPGIPHGTAEQPA
jgi:PAP2 superfamily